MRGVIDDRLQRGAGREIGDFYPGAAAAILRQVRKNERFAQREDTNKGDTHARLIVLAKALLDFGLGPDVERLQRLDCGPIRHVARPFGTGKELDFVLPIGTTGGKCRVCRDPELGSLLMKERGKEKKLGMLEAKSVAALGDSALADDQALPAARERITDEGPFFESKHVWKNGDDCKNAIPQRAWPKEFNSSFYDPARSRLDSGMPYNIDLHCHSWYSGDGVSSPESLIATARRKGLNGFAMTDHNTCDACRYLLDKGLVREDGQPVDDFLVIPGVEVTTAEGHLLCLGVILPYMKGAPALEVCQVTHELGGLAIPPHPYDLFRAGIRESVLDTLPIDGLEVFNAATTLKRYNRYAFDYAQRRNLPMTAGSDAHHESAIGTAYTILNTDDFSVRGILDQIKRGTELNQRYLSAKESFKKTWNNILRLRRKRVHQPSAFNGDPRQD